MSIPESLILGINNLRRRLSKKRWPPSQILLLLPHCLQNQACKAAVQDDIMNCRRCGKCAMKDLRDLAAEKKISVYVASGGRAALTRARSPQVKVILAVACTKEMAEGICGAFPKRVIGILNTWPHGPCKDTDVDTAQVRATLEQILAPET